MYHKKTQGWQKHLDFIILDIICLQAAFVLAYITRHGFSNPFEDALYLNTSVAYLITDLLVLIGNNTMKNVLKRRFPKEMRQSLKHSVLVGLVISVYLFSGQLGVEYSRAVFYLTIPYHLVISLGVRMCWKKFLLRKNVLLSSAYFITTSDRAEHQISQFQQNSLGRYKLQGVCLLDQDRVGDSICGVPVTARKQDLLDHLCSMWVDEVFVSIPVSSDYPADLINSMTEMGIVVHICVEQMPVEDWQRQTIERIAGCAVRTLSMTMATPGDLFLKRALDIVGGIVGCIITGFLVLIIGPMIYIQSPGPIFFKQVRVGRNGKKFTMYKFRSMYLDAEARKAELMKENRVKDGMMFKLDFDPRIIGCKKLPDGTVRKGLGNFLRDWSLDEFPQFFNVLKGDLSLCGTRPPTVDEWEKYELHHRGRLAIKPGITGLWQISGRSNITSFEQVVELDKKYIREWNFALDIQILLRTIKVVLTREGSM